MRRGHGLLYRSDVFEPIAQIGDVVAIRQTQGFVTDDTPSPFYIVTEVASTPRAGGPKGIMGVWCATAGFQAPYTPDTAAQANINLGLAFPGAGGSIQLQPNGFLLVKRQFAQMRFLIKALPDSNGAYIKAIDDFDFQITSPPATPRWGTQRLTGVANAMDQGIELADYGQEVTSGNNIAAISGGASHDPMVFANATETYLYGNQVGGQINLINNGATQTTGGIGFSIGMYLFNLVPFPAGTPTTKQWFLGNADVPVPNGLILNDVIVIPWGTQKDPIGQSGIQS